MEEIKSGKTEAGNDIYELLGFKEDYGSVLLEPEKLVSSGQLKLLKSGTADRLKAGVTEVYNEIREGQVPYMSWCFGMDKTCRADRIYVPFLLNAYRNGLSVAPVISSTDYLVRRVEVDRQRVAEGAFSDFRDYYLNRQIVVMIIPSGTSEEDVLEAKGLMQSRAIKGLPTIFITSRPRVALSEILISEGDEPSYFMCMGAFVEYARDEVRTSSAFSGRGRTPSSTSLDDLRTL